MIVPFVMRFAARSDVGMVRAKNDDSAYAGRYLAVVADGMGGHAGGNVASASTVLDLVHLDRDAYAGDAGTELADEIQTANSLLSELVSTNPQLAGMGTTVTALLLNGDRVELAHIGDSRAYRLRNGVFEQITKDHTFVQRLIDEGRLRPEEADIHPHKNVLMRVLGDVDASPELDLQSLDIVPGERWLLCSDGLNAVLPDSTVEQVFRETGDLRECVDTLVELTLAGGSPDNVTVAVVEIVEATEKDLTAAPPPALPRAREAAGERETPKEAAAKNGSGPASDATDLPGTAIRADIIRQDLLTRPHILVGSAALATETGQIPIVTQRSSERRAALMLTHKAQASGTGLEDEGGEDRPVRRRWLAPAFVTLTALILLAVVGFGYTWTQTRYYVGDSDNKVAIYNGVSQSVGPIRLSQLHEVTNIPVSNLPEHHRSQLAMTLPARDLQEAERIVEDLRSELRALPCTPGSAGGEATTKATDRPSGSPGASPRPSGAAGPSRTPSEEPTGSRSGRPTATPSDAPGARASSSPARTAAPSVSPSPESGAVAGPDCGGTQ